MNVIFQTHDFGPGSSLLASELGHLCFKLLRLGLAIHPLSSFLLFHALELDAGRVHRRPALDNGRHSPLRIDFRAKPFGIETLIVLRVQLCRLYGGFGLPQPALSLFHP